MLLTLHGNFSEMVIPTALVPVYLQPEQLCNIGWPLIDVTEAECTPKIF